MKEAKKERVTEGTKNLINFGVIEVSPAITPPSCAQNDIIQGGTPQVGTSNALYKKERTKMNPREEPPRNKRNKPGCQSTRSESRDHTYRLEPYTHLL
jgi:hypothetical protein